MRLNFLVNEIAGGWEPTDTRLGGTEESVVRWAEELTKKGYLTTVYRNGCGASQTVGGVLYTDRENYIGDGDICINIKSSEVEPEEPTLYLTNETDADKKDLSKYLGVIWPSQWAVDNIPVNNRTFVVPHGYDPKQIYPSKKIPKQCFYASSPDRGLETLIDAWPKVHRAHPDATLLITYGGWFDYPGVINLGGVDESTMNEIYRTSDIWCHPANGGELFCITGLKAQAAGCVPVIIPTMALSETVLNGYFAENANDYAQTLIEALDTPREPLRELMAEETYPSWEVSTNKLLDVINLVLDDNKTKQRK